VSGCGCSRAAQGPCCWKTIDAPARTRLHVLRALPSRHGRAW
jgi:predicted Fe-S protein YdhL (DUF1289 family)